MIKHPFDGYNFHHEIGIALACVFFFFNDTATTEIYTLSLHDALPICRRDAGLLRGGLRGLPSAPARSTRRDGNGTERGRDRKSTRLNSSHDQISYAVFCLKKKKKRRLLTGTTNLVGHTSYAARESTIT